MENDTKTTLNELKEIITRIMTEIKEFDRDALATELDIIMRNNKTDKGTKLGGYGNLSQKEADARRRQEAEKRNRKKQLRSRIRLGSLNSQRSSYLAF
jgi:hypothetical protein